MKLFRCFIAGENFPIDFEGKPELLGFYTTRFVRAESAEQAELITLELLRADPTLDAEPSRRTEDAKVYFESIEEIDSIPDDVSEHGTGYVFYRMEDQSLGETTRPIRPLWRWIIGAVSLAGLASMYVNYQVVQSINVSYFQDSRVPIVVVDIAAALLSVYLLFVAAFGNWRLFFRA